MVTFFRVGGFSMFVVLGCGLAALIIALVASGRPTRPRIALAERLAKATLFFSLAGYASNVAMTLYHTANTKHEEGGLVVMLLTGLYESLSPVIMGFSFIALTHLAVAIAAFRLARREP